MASNPKVSVDQYGRKTWDIEAYAKDAKSRQKGEDEKEIEPKSQIKDDSSMSYVKHRNTLLTESLAAVRQHNLVNPLNTTSTYGRNKKFGFFCPICDLSFRDNLALIDHINSPQHVSRASAVQREAYQDGDLAVETLESGVARAKPGEVAATIESLVKASIHERTQKSTGGLSLQDRIQKRKDFEQQRLLKRKQRRLKQKQNKRPKNDVSQPHNSSIAASMGFASFGTSKQ